MQQVFVAADGSLIMGPAPPESGTDGSTVLSSSDADDGAWLPVAIAVAQVMGSATHRGQTYTLADLLVIASNRYGVTP
jgi:hypothetical protein